MPAKRIKRSYKRKVQLGKKILAAPIMIARGQLEIHIANAQGLTIRHDK